MFAVIFEVQPRPEKWNDYLDLAAALKPKLAAIDGFIDIDRFESKRTKGRVLSLSTWRDEKAVIRWRTHAEHHAAQARGRGEIFLDYRLRVGEVTTDTQAPDGAPLAQHRLDETEIGSAKVATVTEVMTAADDGAGGQPDRVGSELGLTTQGLVDHDVFTSIYTPGKLVLLASWRDAKAAGAWVPTRPASARAWRHRHVRIVRDYGMFERREAPQFYPEVRTLEAQRERPGRAAAG